VRAAHLAYLDIERSKMTSPLHIILRYAVVVLVGKRERLPEAFHCEYFGLTI
jgi:hypothetical protein